jgi:crotonobetainyl-CoA:carnitine CoA-transferase CaiB-like acyl-CoA transferase
MAAGEDLSLEGYRPLEGYRVVDASSYVTGPYAAMMLADLGADVVKVEAPGGDPNRRIGRKCNGIGLLFVNTNRGKRSIALDLKDAEDRKVFDALIAKADVLVENWRPGVADRLGLDDQTLFAANGRLVHLAITGYGSDGPRAGRGAFDSALQAVAGLAWHNAHDGRPELLRTYVVDKATAAMATQATLAALLQRERTGIGRRVDVNMLDAAAYFNFPEVMDARTVVAHVDKVDPEDNPGLRTLVRTADGWMVVAPSTGGHVRAACEAAGHPEWMDDLKVLGDFRQLAPALMARIETATSSGTTEEWLGRFDAHDVPAAPVLDLDAHLADAQVHHNATYGEHDHARIGRHRYPHYPARFTGVEGASSRGAAVLTFPELDEHGADIRQALTRSTP